MMDSGICSSVDVARAMATGADFTFLGRTFMYSVAVLGKQGGKHAIGILKTQLQQVIEQLCCEKTTDILKIIY
jgi:L-lactate dehydrogenase (cytochrome)